MADTEAVVPYPYVVWGCFVSLLLGLVNALPKGVTRPLCVEGSSIDRKEQAVVSERVAQESDKPTFPYAIIIIVADS